MNFNLVLFDDNDAMVEAWSEIFLGGNMEGEDITILNTSADMLEEYDFEGVTFLTVPGNSYGITTPGICEAVDRNNEVMLPHVRQLIEEFFLGELIIGVALPVIDPDPKTVYDRIIYTPTFRVPQTVEGEIPYRIMLGLLQAISANIRINRIMVDELTLIVGNLGDKPHRVPPEDTARQMKAAWDRFKNPTLPEDFLSVTERNF